MDFGSSFEFVAVSILTTMVMLRLSLMRAKPFHGLYAQGMSQIALTTVERMFLFVSTIAVISVGYFLQPAIETILFSSLAESFKTAAKNWLHVILTASVPGAVIAYAIISADNRSSKWMRGCVTSISTLIVFDIWVTLQGGMSYRQFLFSVICDTIGGPVGVIIVIIVHSKFRQFRFR